MRLSVTYNWATSRVDIRPLDERTVELWPELVAPWIEQKRAAHVGKRFDRNDLRALGTELQRHLMAATKGEVYVVTNWREPPVVVREERSELR